MDKLKTSYEEQQQQHTHPGRKNGHFLSAVKTNQVEFRHAVNGTLMWEACLIEWYHFWNNWWPGKVFAEDAKMANYRSVLVAHTLGGA